MTLCQVCYCVAFHRSLPLTEWFAAHPKIFILLFIPQVHTIEALFSSRRWKVYDHQSHDQTSLLEVRKLDLSAGACQGWIRHAKRFAFVLQERTEGVRLMRTCLQMQQTGLCSCCNSMSLAVLHKYVWWICLVYYFSFNLFSVPANLWHKCPMWFGFQVYCPWVVFASYQDVSGCCYLWVKKKNNNSLAFQLPCVKWLWWWECTGVPDNEFNSHPHHVPEFFYNFASSSLHSPASLLSLSILTECFGTVCDATLACFGLCWEPLLHDLAELALQIWQLECW